MNKDCVIFKCVFLGSPNSGKTALTQIFSTNVKVQRYEPTIGVDFQVKTIKVDELTIKLQLWDVSGQEIFRSIVPSYIKNARLAFIVYDVTNRDSFEIVNTKMQQIQNYAPPDCVKILLANKIDQVEQRVITSQQGFDLAEKLQIHYFETTAMHQQYIENIFNFFLHDQNTLNKLRRIDKGEIEFNNRQTYQNQLKQELVYHQDLSLILTFVILACSIILYFITISSNLCEVVQDYKAYFVIMFFSQASIIIYTLFKMKTRQK